MHSGIFQNHTKAPYIFTNRTEDCHLEFKFTWSTQRRSSNLRQSPKLQEDSHVRWRTPPAVAHLGRLTLATGQNQSICCLILLSSAPANTPAVASSGGTCLSPKMAYANSRQLSLLRFLPEQLPGCWLSSWSLCSHWVVPCLPDLHSQSFPMNSQSVVWGKSKVI